MGLTHGSLFAGIGGFDLGFERAGIRTVWQVEIDPYCRRVLEKHFPSARRYEDVRKVHAFNYGYFCGGFECENCLHRVDIITGGDPCQENSNARRAHDTVSPSLGAEFIRIVAESRPRFVLRENPSVVRSDAPWPWWRFRSELEQLGYSVLPFEFRACCVGADHKRERLLLLAEIQNANSTRLEGNEREILEGKNGRKGHGTDIGGPNRWSSSPRICRKADGIRNRVDRLRGLGNAIVPQIAEWIGSRIVAAVREANP